MGQARGRLFLALRNASVAEKLQAYKRLELQLLKEEVHTASEQRELRRRIAEDLLTAASEGSWRLFSPYLRRMERLGYSGLDRRLLACVLAAMASKGSRAGRRKTAELIVDIERRTRGRKYHPALREEINSALERARRLAGLDTEQAVATHRARPSSGRRRGVSSP
ncbi:hypothetical protein ACN28E_48595 [Archangium lansingense]|uniref:hypothetical protein n=1 Tax=Archangium lansingense TaxID=2995310 RepID=UPI003B7D2580